MKWHTSKQFFCFWLIGAILWLLTRNAGVVQFCQKIQFHREGDFKWFRTGSLDIRGTFGSRPEPWLGGRARVQRRWQRWPRLLSKLCPANKTLDEYQKHWGWGGLPDVIQQMWHTGRWETTEVTNVEIMLKATIRSGLRPYFSLFSRSLSSCRLSGLRAITNPSGDSADGGVDGLWKGVDVKQVFGLEWGRSALTGVGFILLEGLDALKKKKTNRKYDVLFQHQVEWGLTRFFSGGNCVDLRWQNGRRANRGEVLHIA